MFAISLLLLVLDRLKRLGSAGLYGSEELEHLRHLQDAKWAHRVGPPKHPRGFQGELPVIAGDYKVIIRDTQNHRVV